MTTSQERTVPERTYEALGRSLYASPGTLVAGIGIASFATVVAAARTGSHTLGWMAAAVGAVGFARLCLHAAYVHLRDGPSTSGYGMAPWRRAYGVGGATFSGVFGLAVMACIAAHDDPVSHMVMLTCSVAYAGAVAGRNAGCPEVSLAQLWCICVPAILALATTGDPAYLLMAAFVACYAVGMGGITRSLNRMFLDTHVAAQAIVDASRLDALTGALNRRALDEAMSRMLASSRPVCVLALDLDRFKAINDTYGHAVGDALLRSLADRIRSVLPEGAVAARMGSDEFIVLCDGTDGAGAAASLSKAIMAVVDRPYSVGGRDVSVTVSIGTTLSPGDGVDGITLMRNADTALYRVKGSGRGGWRPYDRDMDEAFQVRQSLEADLRVALAEGALDVAYQPQMDLASGAVATCEALVRWTHPERGPVPPDAFIPLAEQTGLIYGIGLLVLERACEDALRWPDHVKVAVNLSPVQFRDDVASAVRGVLERTGLPGSRLELEVTESVLMEDRDDVMAAFLRLAAMGVNIALDDFGTGYSSLAYLRSFPFRKVKLDRSFVRGLTDGPESLAIIRAMARLGRDLGMDVVVEGVETEGDLETVSGTDCTTVQGYLLSKPLPPAETLEFLHARVARVRAA